MARTCAIGPADDIDPELMVDWANERLLKEPDKAYVQFVAALARYRAGQFERAIETLKETPRDDPNDLWQAKNSFVIAMSHQRLGDEGAAHEALRRGQERVVDAGPKTSDQPANLAAPDWIELELLRREAIEVLGPDQAKDQDR